MTTKGSETHPQHIVAERLDWTNARQDVSAWARTLDLKKSETKKGLVFDLVVGTDVLFNQELVAPLLTVASVLASKTFILCAQIRCAESHRIFLTRAPDFFESCENITEEVCATKGCEWGREVECLVFKLTNPKLDYSHWIDAKS